MRAVNLSFGSDGNLTYIETASAKILVDIGLSCKETEKRLALLGISGSQIDAILITHEHSDHIKGLDVFASKYNTNVYAHLDGWDAINAKTFKLKSTQKWSFSETPFKVKDLNISAFKLPHDSKCCVGFSFESGTSKISIATDLGKIDQNVLSCIAGSQLVYLEANHNIEMLKANPNYSALLKSRILGPRGHLSNLDCAKAIAYLTQHGTKQIVLSHLSRENNMPEVAYSDVCSYLSSVGITEGVNVKIDIASLQPGKIFRIKSE